MKYKLGLVSVSFREHTPKEILEAMKRAFLSQIEWGSDVHAPPTETENLKRLAAMQEEYGIACSSYGTYFRLGVTPMEELNGYIDAAEILGTRILRLWCGNRNSEDLTGKEKTALFSRCREAAQIAEARGVTLCLECHNKTYTNRKEAALEIMQAVSSEHFRMYWQPNQFRTEKENLLYASLISPYTEHLHVFNWKGKEKFLLRDAKEIWKKYLSCFSGERTLLLEFMPDGNLDSLAGEAKALFEIAGGIE